MDKSYWNNYYSTNGEYRPPLVPSQFATFVANEMIKADTTILELGCGNGRDAHFFSRYGYSVIGVDASEEAIHECKHQAIEISRPEFICSEISCDDLPRKIRKALRTSSVTVYARFFLHAITNTDEGDFFTIASTLLQDGDRIMVEFRTNKDESLKKVTRAHFRRYINPIEFLERASSHGFGCDYFVEGFGYAKFREDDAHVARIILSKSVSEVE